MSKGTTKKSIKTIKPTFEKKTKKPLKHFSPRIIICFIQNYTLFLSNRYKKWQFHVYFIYLKQFKYFICSCQLNIWYGKHHLPPILNWFLIYDLGKEACFSRTTDCPGLTLPPGTVLQSIISNSLSSQLDLTSDAWRFDIEQTMCGYQWTTRPAEDARRTEKLWTTHWTTAHWRRRRSSNGTMKYVNC